MSGDQKIKAAAGKVPLNLLPLRSLKGAARVFGYGGKKYVIGNWYNANDDDFGNRYCGGALRHLSDAQRPDGTFDFESLASLDVESGLPEIDHMLCGLIMLRGLLIKRGVLPEDPGVGADPVPVVPFTDGTTVTIPPMPAGTIVTVQTWPARNASDSPVYGPPTQAVVTKSDNEIRADIRRVLDELHDPPDDTCDCRLCVQRQTFGPLPTDARGVVVESEMPVSALPVVHDMVKGSCPDEPHTHSWNVPLSERTR